MRQVNLVPAGCQLWNPDLVGSGGGRFAYCSTLAIYVHNLETHALERIIAGHSRTITAFTWCPQNPVLVATCGLENMVRVWNLSTEEEVLSFNTVIQEDHSPNCLEWSPFDQNIIASASSVGLVKLWNISTGKCEIVREFMGTHIRVLRWSPTERGTFALASGDHTLYTYCQGTKKPRRLTAMPKGGWAHPEDPVMDMRWDPLSTSYLLVAYKRGVISLWDVESGRELHRFDRTSGTLKSISWIQSMPGAFVSTDERVGMIRIWNVSQKAPRETIKVCKAGFQNFEFIGDSLRAVCSFKDGSVCIYDLKKRRFEHTGDQGHTETVFDCSFKNDNPNLLATGSYDGTIKVWNMSSMECENEFFGHQGVVYCLSWAPGVNEHRLVAASSQSELFVWDTKRGVVLERLQHHSRAIFRVQWNPRDANLIASCSSDGLCVVTRPNGDIVKKYKHPAPAYGVDWNLFNPRMLATGCQDGNVRIYDLGVAGEQPKINLKGHSGKVFNVAWSPLLANTLMSGSDDMTVRVWYLAKSDCKVLKGHTHNVRALAWNPEVPWIAMSGSWDGTIRVWDLRDCSCTRVLSDHHADVYGLAVHPQRPFVYVSCSRDMSLRVWTMEDDVGTVKMKAILNQDWRDVITSPEDSLANKKLALCSTYARETLMPLVRDAKSDVERMKLLFGYFSPPCGMQDLWELVDSSLNGTPCSYQSKIIHMRDTVGVREAQADAFSGEALGGKYAAGSARREEKLKQAADLYMKLGDFRKYCEMQIELGEWERAIATAPAVSLDYWNELSERHADRLSLDERPEAAIYYSAIGHSEKVAAFLKKRDQLEDAFLVARAANEGRFHRPRFEEMRNQDPAPVNDPIHALADEMAAGYYAKARPVLAASCHISVNDADRAVQKLMKGNEIELACAVARSLHVPSVDHVYEAMALRCEKLGAHMSGVEVLQSHRDPRQMVDLLCARYEPTGEHDAADLFTHAGLSLPFTYLETAEEKERQGQTAEAIRCYLLANSPRRAVVLGLGIVKDILMRPTWGLHHMLDVMQPLASVKAHELDPHDRNELLAYWAFIGTHNAMYKGYSSIVTRMFSLCRSLVNAGDFEFCVSLTPLHMQVAAYVVNYDLVLARNLLEELLQLQDMSQNVADYAHALLTRLQTQELRHTNLRSNDIIVTSQNLPTGSNRKCPIISSVSYKQIQGPEYMLEDGTTALTLSEALMWAKVNPFSPLNTGARVNPY